MRPQVIMPGYFWFAILTFWFCVFSISSRVYKLVKLGTRRDLSKPRGDVDSAILYSFTAAMDPRKKESAFLHLPTYAAGIVYHCGTFASLLLLLLVLFADVHLAGFWRWPAAALLFVSGASGIGILAKRIVVEKLRALSNPDDYISNILLTGFHLLSFWALLAGAPYAMYYVWAGCLLLYMPVGKLKHAVYFVAARINAGRFYGWRGVWPTARS